MSLLINMNNQIATQFAQSFDPTNQTHVTWLKDIHRQVEAMDTMKLNFPREVNKNPMKIEFREKHMMDWVHIHFMLNFKYAKAVLSGEAYIPGSPVEIHPGTPST